MSKSSLSFSYRNNCLHAESVSIADLITTYDSPLYVYSRQKIENNWREFDKVFVEHPHLVCYAVKANSNLSVLNVLAKLGAGFDIVSLGELERVLAAKGDAKSCIFSGVGKTIDEIKRGLEVGIRCFNVESSEELNRIEQIAADMGVQAPVSIRVNPNVDAKTHPYISTGLKENKFGINFDETVALCKLVNQSPHLMMQGLACHIGSQLTEVAPFLNALDEVLTLVKKLKDQDIDIAHLDLGGGVGIQYNDEKTIDIVAYVQAILKKAGNLEIVLEPGRSIVGNAGIFVTKIEFLKQNKNKSFAIIDGAMNDLLRPTLYDAYHQVLPVIKNTKGVKAKWDLVGPICESGDFLAKDRELSLLAGDYLAFMSTGAYGFSMSSNYNSRTRVAEVMVSNNQHKLVRERETIKSLFSLECTNYD